MDGATTFWEGDLCVTDAEACLAIARLFQLRDGRVIRRRVGGGQDVEECVRL
jgi:hypothetical protein